MTEEQKIKIRKALYGLDGIEEAEEIIEALEYIEKNPLDEKTLTYVKWFENKFHKADLDRRNFLDQLIKRTDEVTKLYISLFISLITSIALGIYIIYNIK
jgi:hypothetical protein